MSNIKPSGKHVIIDNTKPDIVSVKVSKEKTKHVIRTPKVSDASTNIKVQPEGNNTERKQKNSRKPKKTQVDQTCIGLQETEKTLSIEQYAQLIKNEYDFALAQNIPLHIAYFSGCQQTSCKKYVIKENTNTAYETLLYLMFLYKTINDHTIAEFSRIIYPVNAYSVSLDGLLRSLNELSFLSTIADLKQSL